MIPARFKSLCPDCARKRSKYSGQHPAISEPFTWNVRCDQNDHILIPDFQARVIDKMFINGFILGLAFPVPHENVITSFPETGLFFNSSKPLFQ